MTKRANATGVFSFGADHLERVTTSHQRQHAALRRGRTAARATLFAVAIVGVVAAGTGRGTAAPANASGTVSADAVTIVDGVLAKPLTATKGDAKAGRGWFVDRELGNCLACHANADAADELFHGEVGPSINGVANRYDTAQLRAIVVNSKLVFGPDTLMPAFYKASGFNRNHEDFAGTTILSAQQVEDVVAYLETLK